MRHRLFNILAAMSLVMCVATVALWVRSYWYYDTVAMHYLDEYGFPDSLEFESNNGRVMFGLLRLMKSNSPAQLGWFVDMQSAVPGWRRVFRMTPPELFGFGLEGVAVDPVFDYRGIFVPWWFIALNFAVMPAWAVWRIYGRNRSQQTDLCVTCGYNLTGNTSGICPECGTAIPRDPSKESATA